MAKKHANAGAMTMVKGRPPQVPPQKGFRADRMIQIRKSRQLTQAELAKRIGVSTRQIIRWEKQENEPDAFSMGRIAKGLDVSADYFLGLTDGPSKLYTEDELSAEERKVLFAFRSQDAIAWMNIMSEWLKKKLDSDGDLSDR